MRANVGHATMVNPELIKKYAAVADQSRAALMPAIVESLTYDLTKA